MDVWVDGWAYKMKSILISTGSRKMFERKKFELPKSFTFFIGNQMWYRYGRPLILKLMKNGIIKFHDSIKIDTEIEA